MIEIVYLDRDGTLNEDVGYLSNPKEIRILDGVIPGLKILMAAKIDLAIITNQSGIGRGYFDEADLTLVHESFEASFAAQGIQFAYIEYCPHVPDARCDCRKPAIGMIKKIENRIGRRRGAVVGDKFSDILCGKEAGLVTVLVLTGEGKQALAKGAQPDFIARDMVEAATWLVRVDAP